jgi:pimeloyl-ACP methyl ester carboxylesterase
MVALDLAAGKILWDTKLPQMVLGAATVVNDLVITTTFDVRLVGPKLAEPDHDLVPNLDRAERLPSASHWVHHDEPERVNELLVDFFRRVEA